MSRTDPDLSRRQVLGAAIAAGLLPATAWSAEPIKLGSLLDVSGNFAVYGKPMDMAATLAIEEINASGGLAGRQVLKVAYDTQSDLAHYPRHAQRLVEKDKVDVVVGGILSASREAIRSQLTQAQVLYVYNTLYEGGVCDYNTILTGATPAQQAEVLIPHAMKRFGRKVCVVAADYNYGHAMAKWFQKYIQLGGGETLSVEFFPLPVSDFKAAIAKLRDARPDFVISALVGSAHLMFYRQWAETGMKSRIPLASTTLGVGNEHQVLTPAEGDGILLAYNYSPELATPANQVFLEAWKKRFGDTRLVGELAVAHYQGVKLWAEAVRKAGSTDRGAVLAALNAGLSIDGPSGKVLLDATTHHASLDMHVMEVSNQKLLVRQSFLHLPPRDTQRVCNLRKTPDSAVQHNIAL